MEQRNVIASDFRGGRCEEGNTRHPSERNSAATKESILEVLALVLLGRMENLSWFALKVVLFFASVVFDVNLAL